MKLQGLCLRFYGIRLPVINIDEKCAATYSRGYGIDVKDLLVNTLLSLMHEIIVLLPEALARRGKDSGSEAGSH